MTLEQQVHDLEMRLRKLEKFLELQKYFNDSVIALIDKISLVIEEK